MGSPRELLPASLRALLSSANAALRQGRWVAARREGTEALEAALARDDLGQAASAAVALSLLRWRVRTLPAPLWAVARSHWGWHPEELWEAARVTAEAGQPYLLTQRILDEAPKPPLEVLVPILRRLDAVNAADLWCSMAVRGSSLEAEESLRAIDPRGNTYWSFATALVAWCVGDEAQRGARLQSAAAILEREPFHLNSFASYLVARLPHEPLAQLRDALGARNTAWTFELPPRTSAGQRPEPRVLSQWPEVSARDAEGFLSTERLEPLLSKLASAQSGLSERATRLVWMTLHAREPEVVVAHLEAWLRGLTYLHGFDSENVANVLVFLAPEHQVRCAVAMLASGALQLLYEPAHRNANARLHLLAYGPLDARTERCGWPLLMDVELTAFVKYASAVSRSGRSKDRAELWRSLFALRERGASGSLLELVRSFPEGDPRAVLEEVSILEDQQRGSTLAQLAPYLPGALVPRAFDVARSVSSPEFRFRALFALRDRGPAEKRAALWVELLAIARQTLQGTPDPEQYGGDGLGPYALGRVLEMLVPAIPGEHLDAVGELAERLQEDNLRNKVRPHLRRRGREDLLAAPHEAPAPGDEEAEAEDLVGDDLAAEAAEQRAIEAPTPEAVQSALAEALALVEQPGRGGNAWPLANWLSANASYCEHEQWSRATRALVAQEHAYLPHPSLLMPAFNQVPPQWLRESFDTLLALARRARSVSLALALLEQAPEHRREELLAFLVEQLRGNPSEGFVTSELFCSVVAEVNVEQCLALFESLFGPRPRPQQGRRKIVSYLLERRRDIPRRTLRDRLARCLSEVPFPQLALALSDALELLDREERPLLCQALSDAVSSLRAGSPP